MHTQQLDSEERRLLDAGHKDRLAFQNARKQVFKLKEGGKTPEAKLAIGQIDRATRQNAALGDQAAAASGCLRVDAAALSRTVDRFTLASAPPLALGAGH